METIGMKWKEKNELEGIETAILNAEGEVSRIESLFANPEFHLRHGAQTNELTIELDTAKKQTAALYTRWEELERIQIASEKP